MADKIAKPNYLLLGEKAVLCPLGKPVDLEM